jgi:hypothetical protein
MNRKKNRTKERGVEIFLIFIKFPFGRNVPRKTRAVRGGKGHNIR